MAKRHRITAPPIIQGENIRLYPGDQRYAVSDRGKVYARTVITKYQWREKATVIVNGYHAIRIKRRQHYVHQMVLFCFTSPRPPGMVCRHLDGDRTNNNVNNLCWGTIAENTADAVAHGSYRKQQKEPLTPAQVRKIRLRAAAGQKRKDIAAKFDRTVGHLRRVINGEYGK